MFYWFCFICLAIIGYVGIAIFHQLVGSGAQSLLQAFGNATRLIPLLVGVSVNVLFGGAIYFGFLVSPAAVPVMLAIGVLTTMTYSVLFLGVTLTVMNVFGVLLIVTGIYFLK